MKKDKAISTINEFPQEFDLDELIERLIFVDKVDKGLKQAKASKTYTHSEVREIAKRWKK